MDGSVPAPSVAGRRYVVYLPEGGQATLTLPEGKYAARWFDPRTAVYSEAGMASAPQWTSPEAPDGQDWVLLLERDDAVGGTMPPNA